MNINLVDGSVCELPEGALGTDLAKKIKKDLNGVALVARINGTTQELSSALSDGDEVQILTFEDPEGRDIFWHSSAHVLAQAIQRLYPDAKPTIGPAIETGFYYDFANLEISETDFPQIEEEVKKIVRERLQPKRIEYKAKEDALEVFGENQFKKEMIDALEEGLSAYEQGDFIDLCRGPHIPHTGVIQAFKVMKTSGAYWRANAENEQLTRVYAVAYPDKKQLKAYLRFLEEAKKRDHRLLGKKLNLYSFHEEGPGMPFFHPKGMVIWNELMKFWDEEHKIENYQQIKTPIMLSQNLWETSGHWENYRENMYTSEIDDRKFAIKPMNCPGCMLFFKEGQYSYRQLPLRIAEVGNVHRHELSGALSGLFRVRSFHQDDSHIFMKPEDISSEILGVLNLARRMYKQFGLEYHLELSTRPEKSIGSDEQWELATEGLRSAMDQGEYEYVVNEGDGAFYGPKIDIHIKDAIGRTWQCGTIQLDMSLPERFDLNFDAADGTKQRPIMIHRVIYGSIERFLGILVEHFSGRFPLWLSPVQVRVLAVADRHNEYAEEIAAKFKQAGLRSEVDTASESISKKVRLAQMEQVNYILVVGDQEIEAKNISVRTRANKVLGARNLDEFIEEIQKEFQERLPESQLV
ncbi:MAG: threonyl-tRNA synthetase [bacterium]|jgi:threonyl-tRNA synthetase